MIYYVTFGIIVILFFILIGSIRRGVIETNYSILWILIFVGMGFLSLSPGLLERLSALLEVHYAPSLLFLAGILFIIILIFDLTRRVSKLNRQLVTLSQDYAILKSKLEQKETSQ
jgi:hypothetical protein